MRKWLKQAGVPLLLAGIAALAYGGALRCGFVWDDVPFVQQNESIREWRNVPAFFWDAKASSGGAERAMIYRPLRNLSYLIDYKLWGLNPVGFHLTNLLLHGLVVLLVWRLALFWSGSRWGAAVAAVLFAAHPALSEAVVWVKSRDALLCGAFAAAAFLLFARAWVKPVCPRWAAGVLALTVGAVLSYEVAVALPAMFAAALLLGRPAVLAENKKLAHGVVALSFVVAGLFVAVHHAVLGATAQAAYPVGGKMIPTLITMLPVAVEYVRLLLFPLALNADYFGYPHSFSLFASEVLSAMFVLGLLVIAGMMAARRGDRRVAWGLVWVVAFLAPVSNLVPTMQLMAERFLYVPAIGAAMVAACGYAWVERHRPEGVMVVRAAVAVVLVLFVVRTQARIPDWRDEASLAAANYAADPRNPRALSNWGTLLFFHGRLEAAEEVFVDYHDHFKPDETVEKLLALTFVAQGKPYDALTKAQETIEKNNAAVGSWASLAFAAAKMGESGLGRIACAKAESIGLRSDDDRWQVAMAHRMMGESEKAKKLLGALKGKQTDSAFLLATLARIAGERKDWPAAREYCAVLREMDTEHVVAKQIMETVERQIAMAQ